MQISQESLTQSKEQTIKETKQSAQSLVQTQNYLKFSKKVENAQKQAETISWSQLIPANPIINKNKQPDTQINVKLLQIEKRQTKNKIKPISSSLIKPKKIYESMSSQKLMESMNLFTGYDSQNLLYKKFDNKDFYQLNKIKYFSSVFFPLYSRDNSKFQMNGTLPLYQGMKKIASPISNPFCLIDDFEDELDFNSNFESGNLFAVYKTGSYTYDLILQNDLNTTGCTQWFYFSVNNKRNSNVMAKFNIVNLYKASSLYNQGMKPMVFSTASGKGWKRKGQNIFYEKNCILREGSTSKFYSSLSFSYDFTKQNDTVEFAHAIPYTYTRLIQMLKTLQASKKCVIKSLGMTPLKKSIPIIKFSSQNSKIQKKSIILMARQHPGEVQGSFAIEQILLNLLKSSSQIDFLLWRFNIYIIPMVNVDGVFLGNYRCNANGYDLNRNWQGQQKSKHPEIVYIKQEIKKIMAKQQIQLILDLHGHSNKMNSFFYGNPFGPNPFVLPYVASKINPFILFEECTFNLQKKQKAKTARSVLGNFIKQTGNVYTYQMSFYCGNKNAKIINFYQENFRELGKDLILAIYKVSIETYKEEKTLKQSLYLKEIRKEIFKIQQYLTEKTCEGSDSEAELESIQIEQQRNQETKERLKDMIEQNKDMNNSFEVSNFRQSEDFQSRFGPSLIKFQSYSEQKVTLQQSPSITERMNRNKSLKPRELESYIINHDENLLQKIKKQKIYAHKLKIFGENCLPKPHQSSQRSMIKFSSMFEDKNKEAMRINFVIKTRNKRNQMQDYSILTPLKGDWKNEDCLMNDIVRVNRIEYKKIERQKDRIRMQKSIQRKNSNAEVFKLPFIINNFKF